MRRCEPSTWGLSWVVHSSELNWMLPSTGSLLLRLTARSQLLLDLDQDLMLLLMPRSGRRTCAETKIHKRFLKLPFCALPILFLLPFVLGCVAFFYQALRILPIKSLSCKRIERRALISFETFISDYFLRQMPVIITGCMEQWPACTKWKDINYLKQIAGDRTVPVEVTHHLVLVFLLLLFVFYCIPSLYIRHYKLGLAWTIERKCSFGY